MLESDSVNMVDDSMVEYESADKGMDIPIAFLEVSTCKVMHEECRSPLVACPFRWNRHRVPMPGNKEQPTDALHCALALW